MTIQVDWSMALPVLAGVLPGFHITFHTFGVLGQVPMQVCSKNCDLDSCCLPSTTFRWCWVRLLHRMECTFRMTGVGRAEVADSDWPFTSLSSFLQVESSLAARPLWGPLSVALRRLRSLLFEVGLNRHDFKVHRRCQPRSS